MDWTQIFTQVIGAGIGAVVAVLIPVLVFAYWCGGLSMRMTGMEGRCHDNCERNARKHSKLFEITDEHTKDIGRLRGDVKSLDRRVTLRETAEKTSE